jgi:sec-independent protein translocase protein TatA
VPETNLSSTPVQWSIGGTEEERFVTMDLGPTELLIVLLIALLLFGGAKLPKLARSMGEASREFKKGVDGHKDKDPEEPSTPTA